MKKVSVKKSPFDSLSDETKASLLYGHGGWHTAGIAKKGLDPLEMHDGPLGIRYLKEETGMTLDKTSPSTCFPAPCLLACSFNPSLEEKIGGMMALECRAQKTGMLLAPGVNIKRNPLCGRNFEYLSEDPLLAGEMATGFIKGLQNNGVGACLKHYAANSQETQRMISDSIVDERALQEIYLKGFGIAIKKAQPWTVMSAYNLVNGTYCSDSDYLLRDVLRKQFGFTGAVISDWGGTNDPILSHNHGLDVEMPCYADRRQALLDALKSGKLTR
jgi:beta-glucosidase